LTGPAGEHEVAYRGATAEGGQAVSVTPSDVVLEVDGVLRRFQFARHDGELFVDGDAGSVTFTEVPRFPSPTELVNEGSLRAPLPGTVVSVLVAVGEEVQAGQELLVIEAMKMRHVVRADRAGLVESLAVQIGSTVEVGAVLVEVS
jgi:propionyl-CoA carboxylase alpha chain